MTIYETIKAAISIKQAAEHYGLNVNRNGTAVVKMDTLRIFRRNCRRSRRCRYSSRSSCSSCRS